MELRLSSPINHLVAEWRIRSCCNSIKLCQENTLHGYLCGNTAVVYALLCNGHNINNMWCCSVATAPLDSQYYEWKHSFDGRQLEEWMRQSQKLTSVRPLRSDDVKHHTTGALSCLVLGGACFPFFLTVGSPHLQHARQTLKPQRCAACGRSEIFSRLWHNCVSPVFFHVFGAPGFCV